MVEYNEVCVSVALELLKSAIDKAGYPDKIIIGMDVAASEFFRSGKYDLDFKSPDDPKRHITGDQLGDLYKSFIKNYPGTPTDSLSHSHRQTTQSRFVQDQPCSCVSAPGSALSPVHRGSVRSG